MVICGTEFAIGEGGEKVVNVEVLRRASRRVNSDQ